MYYACNACLFLHSAFVFRIRRPTNRTAAVSQNRKSRAASLRGARRHVAPPHRRIADRSSRARYYINAFQKVRKYATGGGRRYGRLDPFSGLPKGSRTCFDQSFLHGSLVKVRRRMPFRD